MPYKLTDVHTTADAGLEVLGASPEELFADAAIGMTEIMVELDGLTEKREVAFDLEGTTLDDLFFNWLSEVIFYKDAECLLLKRCELKILEEDEKFTLRARIFGDEIDPERHTLKVDVKAVTYYRFGIKKEDDHWRGMVVFDL
ncbi:MAG: archease [Candidatus Zixiibacteriota bacterium]|nr:MAG: archease [candidate division Zixibacteria bacterium]